MKPLETGGSASDATPGRSCPLDYRYTPCDIALAPSQPLDALYAAGGLYGNLTALHHVRALYQADPGARKELVFNGDFHWFDAQPEWFQAVETGVAEHTRTRGNVETEFSRGLGSDAGCGCAYPAQVDQGVVDRSNRIEQALAGVAQACFDTERWSALPMFVVRELAGMRVAVVHGDAWSLSGWSFMKGVAPQVLAQACEQAQVQLFLSSHTCESFALLDGQGQWGVLNNGAVGMPAFEDPRWGVVCRVGVEPSESTPLARWRHGPLWCEWLPVQCRGEAFDQRFFERWPPGSDAHLSYADRILRGTAQPLPNTSTTGA